MGGEVKPTGAIWGGAAHGKFTFRGDGYGMADIHIFDPFTDANDDYAVLEWARKQEWFGKFQAALSDLRPGYSFPSYQYQIGDYARAALKVI